MNTRLWWDVVVGLVLIGLAALGALNTVGFAAQVTLVGLLAGFGLVYGTVGRRCVPLQVGSAEPDPSVGFSLAGQLPMIAFAAGAVAINANMMNMMIIVLPLIWLSSSGPKQAIIVTVIATSMLGVGYAANQQWSTSGLISAAAIAVISAVFSTALGLWISSIASWGSERSRLLTELTEAQGALEAAHRESGATTERERLARDIHDTIAQSLTSIVMLAERAAREPEPRQTIALLEDTARDALSDARELVATNAAVSAERTPLAGSIARLGEHFSRETSMQVTTAVDLASPLPRELEVMLLRCTQEGLANVRKHSSARAVAVTLRDTAAEVVLTIADDGQGLGGVSIDSGLGFGLMGMRDRVGIASGTLSIQDAEPAGVVLTVSVPLSPVEPTGAAS